MNVAPSFASVIKCAVCDEAQRTASQRQERARGITRNLGGLARIVFAKERPEVLANQPPFEQIGGYHIVKEIGRGGMATVFQVEDSAGQTYALKLLHQGPQNNDKKWSVRFEREFRLLSKLRHPNLIAVHDYGQHEDYPFFVMDYIEGTDLWSFYQKQLRNHTTEGRVRLLLPLMAQIISALDYIHTHRVVHQDLKPANILLDGTYERAFLADFGLARELRHDISMVTHAGFLGTLGYAPPEIVERGRLDGRADLYSLGVILYICFADRRPIPVKGRALHEIAMAVLEEEPPPISSFCPDLPPLMAEAIHRCMQKDATQRYVNAKALWAALRPMYQDFFGDKAAPAMALSLPASVVPSVPMVGDWLPDMVGREPERAEIEARLDLLSRKHQGALVLVSGSTGIGKSLFLEEMTRQAHHSLEHVIHLAFRPHHSPFQSLAEFLLGLFPHLPTALQHDPCIQILAHYLPLMREHLDIPSMEMPPLRQPSEEIWGLLYPLLLDLFAEGPQAWFLDDLHHADAASLLILRKMMSFFLGEGQLPLLVVGAISRQAEAAFVLPQDDRVLRIALPPLSEEEETALVAQIHGHWPQPEAMQELRRLSEGVPLRTLEFLHQGWWLQQAEHATGAATQDNPSWTARPDQPTPKQESAPTTQPPLSEGTQVLQLSDLIFEEEMSLSSPLSGRHPSSFPASGRAPSSVPASDVEVRRKSLVRTLTDDESSLLAANLPSIDSEATGPQLSTVNVSSFAQKAPHSSTTTASASTPVVASSSRHSAEKATLLDLRSPFVVYAPEPVVPHTPEPAVSHTSEPVEPPSSNADDQTFSRSEKPRHTMEPKSWATEQGGHTQDGLFAISQAEDVELLSELNSDSTPHNLPRVTERSFESPPTKSAMVLSSEGDVDSAPSSRGLRGKTTHRERDPDSTDRLPPPVRVESTAALGELSPSSAFVVQQNPSVILPPLFFQPGEIEELELELEIEDPKDAPSKGLTAQSRDLPSGGLGPPQRDVPSGGLGTPQRDVPSGGLGTRSQDLVSGGGIHPASPVGQALLARTQQKTVEAVSSEQTMVMSKMPMLEALRAEIAWRESTQQEQGVGQELVLEEDEEGDQTGVNALSPYPAENRLVAPSTASPAPQKAVFSSPSQTSVPSATSQKAVFSSPSDAEAHRSEGFADTSEQPFFQESPVPLSPQHKLSSPPHHLRRYPATTEVDAPVLPPANVYTHTQQSSSSRSHHAINPSIGGDSHAKPIVRVSDANGMDTLSSSELAIRPLLERRVAMLPPQLIVPVRGCAFLVEPFSVEEIQAVCTSERAETLDLINQLLRLRFFQLRSWGDDERYAFCFPILRDIARSALSAEEQSFFCASCCTSHVAISRVSGACGDRTCCRGALFTGRSTERSLLLAI
jgi:serine/threonine protein kinase